MRMRFGNFQQQVLDIERFNVSDYISKNKFTKTSLYLLSKKKKLAHKKLEICAKQTCLKMMMTMIISN